MSLVSPTGSTITLTVNKTSVPISGTAEVTAAVIESAGTPVQNGTVVTFTSSFGVIEPREARTEGGTARVTFTGTQSGTAKIGAFSGGAKTTAELEVKVGAAAAESLKPRRAALGSTGRRILPDHGERHRRSGSPCPTCRSCLPRATERLAPVRLTTDGNGDARTTLTTTRESKVIATVAAKTGEITVTVVNAPTVAISCPAASTVVPAGVPVTCTITPTAVTGGSAISNVTVMWGDGTGEQPLGNVTGATTVSHTYQSPGSYTATASATDQNGQRGTGSATIVVTRTTPVITITITTTGTVNTPVSFTVNPIKSESAAGQRAVDFGVARHATSVIPGQRPSRRHTQ